MNPLPASSTGFLKFISRHWLGTALLAGVVVLAGGYFRHSGGGNGSRKTAPRQPVRWIETVETMVRHLESLDTEAAARTRYFSLAPLHNNPRVPAQSLDSCRQALRETLEQFLLESRRPFSWQALDNAQTVLAIDLRDFHWEKEPGWLRQVATYPYGLSYELSQDRALADAESRLRSLVAGEPLPCLRADWFVAHCLAAWDQSGARQIARDSVIRQVAQSYQADLDAEQAAGELGLLDAASGAPNTAALVQGIDSNSRWSKDLQLGALCRQQRIARDLWVAKGRSVTSFQELGRDLAGGLPIVPQPPLSPSER